MRVAQVCPYSLSVPGGVQTQVLGLASALTRLGHEVEVIGPLDGAVLGGEAGDDVAVTGVGRSARFRANGSRAPVSPFPASSLRSARAVSRGRFDLAHLHEPLVPGPTLAVLARGRLPMVGTFHRFGASAPYRAFGAVLRPLAARLDVRCAVSEDAAETARRAVGGDCEVLFNGVSVHLFEGASPWPSPAPTVVFVGRHDKRKGLGVLLEAHRWLPEGTRLWVLGDGPETGRLRRLAAGAPGIEWLGAVDDPEKASRIAGASVLCAPSLFGESFGVVLLEAMSAGTPVVASDIPAYRAVGAGGAAELVPAGDPRSLAEALARVLAEPALAERMAQRGRSRAAEYSMDRLAASYSAIYSEVRVAVA